MQEIRSQWLSFLQLSSMSVISINIPSTKANHMANADIESAHESQKGDHEYLLDGILISYIWEKVLSFHSFFKLVNWSLGSVSD